MTHNGNTLQLVPGFLQTSGDFVLINHLRTAQWWLNTTGNGFANPANFDAMGNPTSIPSGGLYTVFYVPLPTQYSGDWIIDWIGDFSFSFGTSNGAPDGAAGNSSGVNGIWRRKFTGSDGRVVFRIDAMGTPVASPRIRIYRADHADDQTSGYITTPEFRTIVRSAYGTLRDLDISYKNRSTESSWAMRRPYGYAVCGSDYPMLSLLCDGAMSNTGDAYEIAKADFVLQHKASIIAQVNATSSSDVPTLKITGKTGDIVIKNSSGDALSAGNNDRMLSGRWGHFTYDADLSCWIKFGGCLDPGSAVLQNGLGPEEFLQICDECGCHPWIVPPYLACDNPNSDWVSSYNTLIRDTYPWMIPRQELGPNELWNSAAGFPQTRYSWNKANARWGSSFDHHNWYGMTASLIGMEVSAIYSADRSRYRTMMGYQTLNTIGDLTAQNARQNSTRFLTETIAGGFPADIPSSYAAKNLATNTAATNYWFFNKTTAELITSGRADAYASANTEVQQATLDWYIGDHDFGVDYQHHADWAASFGQVLTFYEGGNSIGRFTSGQTVFLTISGASKAAQCVLTVSTTDNSGLVGKTLPIASVAGMTQLNGNSYQVVSVSGNQVTINVNSTGFSTYTSGGTVALTGYDVIGNVIKEDSRNCRNTYKRTRQLYNELIRVGGVEPSQFNLGAGGQTPLNWGVYTNNIMGIEGQSIVAQRHIAAGITRYRLTTS